MLKKIKHRIRVKKAIKDIDKYLNPTFIFLINHYHYLVSLMDENRELYGRSNKCFNKLEKALEKVRNKMISFHLGKIRGRQWK